MRGIASNQEGWTARQQQVLELRRSGLSFAAIGRRLGISGERARQIMAMIQSRRRVREMLEDRGARSGLDQTARELSADANLVREIARLSASVHDFFD
jgi:Sigma-70, region 4